MTSLIETNENIEMESFKEPNFHTKVKSVQLSKSVWYDMNLDAVLQTINVALLILHGSLVHKKKALGLSPALGGADKFPLTANWN